MKAGAMPRPASCPALQMGKKTWLKMGAGPKIHFGGAKVLGKMKELGATWMVSGRLHALACRVYDNNGAEVLAYEFSLHHHCADPPH